MPIATFYPEAHPETSSIDGQVSHQTASGNGEVWANLRDGAGTHFDDVSSVLIAAYFNPGSDTDRWAIIRRGIQLYNISPILGGTPISAIVSLFGFGKLDQAPTPIAPDINIYSSAPASDNVLVAGDYNSLGTTPLCDTPITYANFVHSTTVPVANNFTLNAAGLSVLTTALAGDGIVRIGTRNANYDVADTPPTWSYPGAASLGIHSADKGGSFRPRLVIIYTTTAPGTIWVEDTDSPVDRTHFIDSVGIEQTNLATVDVDDTPVDGATTDPISSNWAYDYEQLWEDKKKLVYLGL